MSQRILIIDDDQALTRMVAEYLSGGGMSVTATESASTGLAMVRRDRFDALVLDVMLPDGDGFDLCRQIRSELDIPILMLTARGEHTDRIVGLELGADDYLPKPFNPRELQARLRAILRCGASANPRAVLRFGELEIDRDARTVRLRGGNAP